ncbi:sensor histidine kinase [Undibacterium sp. JH2W]|uniref:sensor histidine kinase n=1 Tax=Undibacterium sp. JH2W TaxID=3413037 RepID=UPI003BF0941A
MPDVFPSEMKNGWNITSPTYFATPLADGRKLLARSQSGVSVSLWQIVTPLMIAFAVALGSYPVVRRLTMRLERLNDSVSALGKGQLSTRVAVEGSDEVARLATSFNQSAARIETLVNAQKSLLANASHELRSPLTRIRMGIEMLQSQAQPGLQAELKRSINELDQLIDEILLSSRLEARYEETFTSEAVDMLSLLSEESARVNADISCRDITSDSAVVMGDARLLRRLLRNLLENARRHGVINGNEEISSLIYRSENMLVIEINDRGTGIPAEQRERIFEPFYRLPGAKESDGGVGLGLSLVKQIAQKHAAEITCLEREGGGSCFRFSMQQTGHY